MIAHLDCSSGISGDKFLGALIDAGFSPDALRAGIGPLGIASEDVVVERVISGGIAAVRVGLTAAAEAAAQPLRHLAQIRALLAAASLPDAVAARADRAFTLLGEAEAHVHGVSIDEVHFHEISALDTILDIVGVALGLEALGIEELIATPLVLGSGTIEAEHGRLPVPAPATVQLLLGVPTTTGPTLATGEPAGELTTPTGAALVRAFATGYGPMPPMVPTASGYGAGTRDLGFPNVARIVLGEAGQQAAAVGGSAGEVSVESVTVLETNIDHLTPEQLAFCAEELLGDGAFDVWQTPIVMKKGRAAVALSVMCAPAQAERFAARVHSLTGTLGVRRRDEQRTVAAREVREVETRYGRLRVKVALTNAGTHTRPEHVDVARIARETDAPIARIAEELAADIASALGES